MEPFCLEINLLAQKATVSTHALIDSGADLNVIHGKFGMQWGNQNSIHQSLDLLVFLKWNQNAWAALLSK